MGDVIDIGQGKPEKPKRTMTPEQKAKWKARVMATTN